MSSKPKVFSIPGLRNSNTDHWQSQWENQHDNFFRINQTNWEQPDCQTWVNQINKILQPVLEDTIVISAHSVGCAAFVHWYSQFRQPLKGALLVAPSDVEHPGYPDYITGFAPLPLQKLPFKTIVVASTNDHVVALDRAKYFAGCWGSELIILENAGHIEPKSGFGAWKEGLLILQQLC